MLIIWWWAAGEAVVQITLIRLAVVVAELVDFALDHLVLLLVIYRLWLELEVLVQLQGLRLGLILYFQVLPRLVAAVVALGIQARELALMVVRVVDLVFWVISAMAIHQIQVQARGIMVAYQIIQIKLEEAGEEHLPLVVLRVVELAEVVELDP
jgi:hypothetical protein